MILNDCIWMVFIYEINALGIINGSQSEIRLIKTPSHKAAGSLFLARKAG